MKRHIIDTSFRLIDAIERLNALSGRVLTLLVTDPDGRMAGTLTDGDTRRALLRGISLDAPVTEAIHRNYCAIREGEDAVMLLRTMRENGIRLVPVLDSNDHIVKIIDTHHTRTLLPVGAILMAGGKGERLRPLTLSTPKPLLKVGGRPIIDYNIAALTAAGVEDISVTVNYLAEQIEEHFSHPVDGIKVKCVRESQALGTIGSASLCDIPPEGDTLVMNSDLLTTVSFEEMYLRHREEHAAITIGVIPYNVSVPYAILRTDGARVISLEEKPSFSYYANAGIYLIANRLLKAIPRGTRMDAPDFIEKMIAEGEKVTYLPISGTWIDIGSPADYAHACELMQLEMGH